MCDKSRSEIEAIVERTKRPYNTFAIATLYNPFPNFKLAERIISQYNDMIRSVAARHGLVLVEGPKLFRGKEPTYVEHYRNGVFRDVRLVRNPIHPTDEGHLALYQGFYRAINRARARAKANKRRSGRQSWQA